MNLNENSIDSPIDSSRFFNFDSIAIQSLFNAKQCFYLVAFTALISR